MKTTEAADFFNLHKVFPKFSHKGILCHRLSRMMCVMLVGGNVASS